MKMKKIIILFLFTLPFFIKAQSGCSDPAADNYFCNTPAGQTGGCMMVGFDPITGPIWSLPFGFTDDGSCIYYGCTDSSADNYDSSANTDDGSCVISGCTDDGQQSWSVNPGTPACNYDSAANLNDGSCTYPLTYYDCNNICINDTDGDGVCDELEVLGCTDPNAFSGYNPNATDDDGSCVSVVFGCTDNTMFNYNSLANTDDGSCVPFVYGCMDTNACNYNSLANSGNSCVYAETYYDCNSECLNDSDADGVCDELEVLGCTDNSAFNYSSSATDDDGSCVPFIVGCMDSTASNYDISANTACSGCCYYNPGCTDPNAFNYDSAADFNDGSCVATVYGCMDSLACNFNPDANTGNSCIYPQNYYNCDDECINDSDSDGVCDELEIAGCTDSNAYNFAVEATDDDGSCVPFIVGCMDSTASNFDATANSPCSECCYYAPGCTDPLYFEFHSQGYTADYDDGSCNELAVYGCMETLACNFNPNANLGNGCVYAETYYGCNGECLNDSDGDGVCDELEISGCSSPVACNYNSQATDDDGSCEYTTCYGCMDSLACNYDSSYLFQDASCEYAVTYYDCNNVCLNDSDSDGVCDELEVPGCTDSTYLEYSASATDDDGSCLVIALPGCTNDIYAEYYNQGFISNVDDGSCLEIAVFGCTDSNAINQNNEANVDDESCYYNPGCTDSSAFNYDLNADHNDGSCYYNPGCTDSSAFNFDTSADFDDGSCVATIIGCIDSDAVNYDSQANTDDGTCCYVSGCTDTSAFNFEPDACLDDGSCIAVVLGCTADDALNFDTTANTDDGTCYYVPGCTDVNAFNYNVNADFNDGTCAYNPGCTDPFAFNYSSEADFDDGTCVAVILGCTDSTALNYDATANTNDGSCVAYLYGCLDDSACNYDSTANTSDGSCSYAQEYYDCNDVCLSDVDGDGVCDELEVPGCTDNTAFNFNILATEDDDSCIAISNGCTDSNALNYDSTANTDDGSCYYVPGCTDISAYNYNVNADFDDGSCTPFIYGCTNPVSFNYNSLANSDDGSCIEVVLGCTDSDALNYDSTANTDDGSCIAVVEGCTDITAFNYDPTANTDDGSCIPFILGCTDSNAFNYNSNANTNNGTCVPYIFGCTDSSAYNYDLTSNTDDGSCYYTPGCTDENAYNYSLDADFDNGSCAYIPGCTDLSSLNYNSSADIDDGSCCYIGGCTDSSAFNFSNQACFDDGSCIAVIDGCIDVAALNYDSTANTDDGSCCYIAGCTDASAFNYNDQACFDDGTCVAVILGCTDSTALNYDATANTNDGSCVAYLYGCLDDSACNYDSTANTSDGSCSYAQEYYDCNDVCLSDVDGDGVCDELEVPGCTDNTAFNFNILATEDDDSCIAISNGCTDSNALNYDSTANTDDGSCYYVPGCTDISAYNYNVNADFDDGSCTPFIYGCTNPVSFNYNSLANSDDGSCIEVVLGCTDSDALNYDSTANTDDGSCIAVVEGCTDITAFNYDPTANTDDGSCIPFIYGCQDTQACNYNPQANIGNDCEYAQEYYDCNDVCLSDVDGDGVCDELEVLGCTDNTAFNFNILATEDDDSCIAISNGCTDSNALNYDSTANTDDGSCYYVPGCTDISAYNYNVNADFDDGSCTPFIYGCTNPVSFNYNSLANSDDGSCIEVVLGCTDSDALNYDSTANTDDGSCIAVVEGCTDITAFNYDPTANTDDGSCIPFIYGCQDTQACNYNPQANIGNDCEYAQEYYDCNDVCLSDVDGDGVCDELEVLGCTDNTAFNFNILATEEDGSCIPIISGCTNPSSYNYDSTANTDDGSCCYISGCTDGSAFNYNDQACFDDGSCVAVVNGCTDVSALNFDSESNTDDGSCCYIGGCTDSSAFNYNNEACVDDGTCIAIVYGCTDPTAFNFDLNIGANTDDGSCIAVNFGCIDSIAYNYTPDANTDDGSCLYEGCTDNQFLEYYSQGFDASIDNGSCSTPAIFGCLLEEFSNFDSNANVDSSFDPSGQAEACFHVFGCTDELACNFNTSASLDDNTCFYLQDLSVNIDGIFYDCDGECINDSDLDGICDEFEVVGCQDQTADNYNLAATDSGFCIFYGCIDEDACNYDISANTDDGSCWYPSEDYLDCEGNCISDIDFDGVCDEAEIFGCTDINASNYLDSATEEDNSCIYSCDYLLSEDSFIDSNYDNTFSNYNCYQYVWTYGFYTVEEAEQNGYNCDCVEPPIPGCTDSLAINYDIDANQSNNSCEYDCESLGLSSVYIDISGGLYPSEISWNINDSDNNVLIFDGVPEMPMQYCFDPQVCYTLFANDSYGDGWNGNVIYIYGEEFDYNYSLYSGFSGTFTFGENCPPIIEETDNCTDETACNYNINATVDDGSCIYASDYYDCFGECLFDIDGDGICDELEVFGCTDLFSTNYNPNATEDDESCLFVNTGVTHGITISSALVDNSELSSGSIIGVFYDGDDNPFTTDWVCGGSVVWQQGASAFIAAMRDDPNTDNKDGFNVGEEFHFMVYSSDINCNISDATNLIWSDESIWNAESSFEVNGMSGLDLLEITNLTIVSQISDYNGFGVSCNGANDGWIDVTILGGTPPYTYLWSHGSQSEDIPAGLVAKTYTLTVTDSKGCSFTEDINLTETEKLEVLYETSNFSSYGISCNGSSDGWIDLSVSGGTGNYYYNWSSGQDSEDISNLSYGTYSVVVTDENGCTFEIDSIELTEPSDPISIELTQSEFSGYGISCYGESDGFIDVTVSGGTGVYNYEWSNGSVLEDQSNLGPGTYSLSVSDENGCYALTDVVITEPQELIISSSISDYSGYNVSCNSESNGWIDIDVSGGDGEYTYAWIGLDGTFFSVNDDIQNLSAGEYTLTVTDERNCSTSALIEITESPEMTISEVHSDYTGYGVSCNGASDGFIDITVEGGTGIYSYEWSNGAFSEDISNLTAGTYSVTATDENGCSVSIEVIITETDEMTISEVHSDYTGFGVSCNGATDGFIDITVQGGTGSYVYEWSNGETTEDLSSVGAGSYSVNVTDDNGCTVSINITLSQPDAIQIVVESIVPGPHIMSDITSPFGSISIDVFSCNLDAQFSYSWQSELDSSFSSQAQDVSNLFAGNYYVTVTDTDGNSITAEITVPFISPSDWSVVETPFFHEIEIPSDASITIDFDAITYGDYIAVGSGVEVNENGEMLSGSIGGMVMWNGSFDVLNAYNSVFNNGDVFEWMIWDASTGMYYSADAVYDVDYPNTDSFEVGGLSHVTDIVTRTVFAQAIELPAGWGIYSTFISPVDGSLETVLADVVDNLIIMKNESGGVYWPLLGINSIVNLSDGEGYQIKMGAGDLLDISGDLIPSDFEMFMPEGWSYIAYLHQDAGGAESMMQPLSDNLVILKDGAGSVYWPFIGVNALDGGSGLMKPGLGYQIKVSEDATFSYPEMDGASRFASNPTPIYPLTKYANSTNTGSNMTIGIPVSAWDVVPEDGDEIAAYTESGKLVGSVTYTGSATALTVWGDDATTDEVEGLTEGEKITFELWRKSENRVELLEVKDWTEGNNVYAENGIAVAGNITTLVEGLGYELYPNVPNPFSSLTSVSFFAPKSGEVVIGVYDMLGNLVKELTNATYDAGMYKLDFRSDDVAPGTYFYANDSFGILGD